jgi:hypothetical protein
MKSVKQTHSEKTHWEIDLIPSEIDLRSLKIMAPTDDNVSNNNDNVNDDTQSLYII